MTTNIDDDFIMSNTQKNACLDNIVNNEYTYPQKTAKTRLEFYKKEFSKYAVFLYVKKALSMVNTPDYILSCSEFFLPKVQGAAFVRYFNEDNIGAVEYLRTQLCYCRNIWLCPKCRGFITYERAREISNAFEQWVNQGNRCYMLTLTAKHTASTRAVDFIPQMQRAYTLYRYSRVFKSVFNNTNKNKGIISNYEFTFGKGGIHPHRHLLLFIDNGFDILSLKERLLNEWVRCCDKAGLVSKAKALDLSLMKSSVDYISKIGWELTSSTTKLNKFKIDRLNYYELCDRVHKCESWAKSQLQDYIYATKGLRALHWSKGLKDYFGIKELSNDDIIEKRKKIFIAWISKKSYMDLSTEDITSLLIELNVAGGNIYDSYIQEICKNLNLDLYDDKVNLIYNYGNDTYKDITLIKEQRALDFKDGDLLLSDKKEQLNI